MNAINTCHILYSTLPESCAFSLCSRPLKASQVARLCTRSTQITFAYINQSMCMWDVFNNAFKLSGHECDSAQCSFHLCPEFLLSSSKRRPFNVNKPLSQLILYSKENVNFIMRVFPPHSTHIHFALFYSTSPYNKTI